jgi:[acyl-carrier-protein] S-malonyltransferase
MRPAAERLAEDLRAAKFADPRVPLVNNVDAETVQNARDARIGLERQVASPVRWEESIGRLLTEGVTRFVEVGPGKVLTGLVRKIDRKVQTASVEEAEDVVDVLAGGR